MTINSKEEMEELLSKVLRAQQEVASLVRSLSDDPATQALILHTACNITLDDYDVGSKELAMFSDMAPRMDAIVELGYMSVTKSLEDGSYDQVFSESVEIGAEEIEDALVSCPCMECIKEDPVDDKFGIN